MTPFILRQAAHDIHQGGVIAYPTEAVFGLGCDPLNADAVYRILEIKQRPVHKGLILIAASFSQLEPFVDASDRKLCQRAFDSWPGANTWLFPVTSATPYWLTGDHDTLAVRVTAHPLARALCLQSRTPLVSTSANRSRQQPARTALECRLRCPGVDRIVHGRVNREARPSVIRDLRSGQTIRA